jgi:hypothetical protein
LKALITGLMAAGVLATIIAAVQFGTAIEQIMPDSYPSSLPLACDQVSASAISIAFYTFSKSWPYFMAVLVNYLVFYGVLS